MNHFEGSAFWIFPDGSAVLFRFKKHIQIICEDPKRFNTTEKALRQVFDDFGEPWASERKAREEIIRELYPQGYIRVRHYRNRWSVDFWQLDLNTLLLIGALADFLKGRGLSQHEELCLKEFSREQEQILSLQAILEGRLYEKRDQSKPDAFPPLKIEELD